MIIPIPVEFVTDRSPMALPVMDGDINAIPIVIPNKSRTDDNVCLNLIPSSISFSVYWYI